MTTINALKNLYVELGGNIKDVENITIIPEMINALSEIAGSTIELPGVTAEDNGDILTVVEGKWAKAEAPEELPAVTTSDEGNALIVDSEGKWAKSDIPSQLPEVTSADAGDVLTVNSEGKWAKADAGGKIKVISLTVGGLLPDGVNYTSIKNDYLNGIMTIITTSNSVPKRAYYLVDVDDAIANTIMFYTPPFYYYGALQCQRLEISGNTATLRPADTIATTQQ